ncbi:hypothetical protein Xen7305DRAFT_00009570 [Xenococcus sp. PCC 7305]|uniref:hypothetical protein n=1 Tax=Xenococcus sp. PCC 7305 TaxID=102125 RepID=UPI0002ACE66F|nr:hypothetical protein [Xenococcus sp. PCC 7305]ELS01254.1 hypothetical protein Xen7305DRAFT_00009570 [Xenococcus sp. PCC 7305]
MLTYSKESAQLEKAAQEERKKQERLRDVLLLLQQLVEREEITLKLIIDCLYDVGTINIINKKYQNRPTNRFLKAIARLSKPVLRAVALRWVKKNLPTLLTDWLEGKVSFNDE